VVQPPARHTVISVHTAAEVNYGLAAGRAADPAATPGVAKGVNPKRFTSSTHPRSFLSPDSARMDQLATTG
jgi:putative transposase